VYRENQERKCPTCSEWISATAPKCFNCGEYVDGRDDEKEEADSSFGSKSWMIVIITAVFGGSLALYVLTR
jgi:hypothetical protein